MSGKVLDLQRELTRDGLAVEISDMWQKWDLARASWKVEKEELRNFIFATDTTKTSNSKLPWSNKTTLPKLCQIRDNLHANYMAALFPSDEWLKWDAYSSDSMQKDKRESIEKYMSNKIRQSNFRDIVSQLAYDYIDYGNSFTDVEFVVDKNEDKDTGEVIIDYVGPVLKRVSPLDIVFNPTSSSFKESPKITRSIKTIGELVYEAETRPEMKYNSDIVKEAQNLRSRMTAFSTPDFEKAAAYNIDGFGSLNDYYGGNYVEILEFEGSVYDSDTQTFLKDRLITIIDRRVVIRNIPHPNWFGKSTKRHCGWRKRPDNLWAMGPLDNLVGMQYRIDHLENLKADVFDMIAYPMHKIKGSVEEFTYGPNEEIFLRDDGEVEHLRPDTTALNADMQINILEQKMEDMAGAPKQAMGIRTPGEKTAFEVQTLDNATSRIFNQKTQNFEINLLEPSLNDMLESARRNMDTDEVIKVFDDDIGAETFKSVTKEDITGKGKLRPIGARNFAATAQMVQNVNGIFNSPVGQIIAPHTSSIEMAKLVEDVLNLDRYSLIKPNIASYEEADRQKLVNQLQENVDVVSDTPVEEDLIDEQ